MPGQLKPSQTHEGASATRTPFPGLDLTHTGYKSRERESDSDAKVCGVPPRGWARPPLYSASCAAATHVRSFGPKDDEVASAPQAVTQPSPEAHVFCSKCPRPDPCLTMQHAPPLSSPINRKSYDFLGRQGVA